MSDRMVFPEHDVDTGFIRIDIGHQGCRRSYSAAGSVLVIVLAVILAMMTLGLLFMRVMGTETLAAENLYSRTQAIFIAEAGAHVGIVWLQDNNNWPVVLPKAPATLPLAAGSITYRIDTTAQPNRAVVVAQGDVGRSVRNLRITVSR